MFSPHSLERVGRGEALIELPCEGFERLISPAPANVGHRDNREIVLRLNQNIGQVHLIGPAVEKKRLTRKWHFHREPANP